MKARGGGVILVESLASVGSACAWRVCGRQRCRPSTRTCIAFLETVRPTRARAIVCVCVALRRLCLRTPSPPARASAVSVPEFSPPLSPLRLSTPGCRTCPSPPSRLGRFTIPPCSFIICLVWLRFVCCPHVCALFHLKTCVRHAVLWASHSLPRVLVACSCCMVCAGPLSTRPLPVSPQRGCRRLPYRSLCCVGCTCAAAAAAAPSLSLAPAPPASSFSLVFRDRPLCASLRPSGPLGDAASSQMHRNEPRPPAPLHFAVQRSHCRHPRQHHDRFRSVPLPELWLAATEACRTTAL